VAPGAVDAPREHAHCLNHRKNTGRLDLNRFEQLQMGSLETSVGVGSRSRLIVSSALLLFLELAIVRWTSAELPSLSFFKNLVLLSAFLGGGLGIAAGSRHPRLGWALPPLLLLVALGIPLLSNSSCGTGMRIGDNDEFIWTLRALPTVLSTLGSLLFFMVVFAADFALFAACGALVGRALASFRPLDGYTWTWSDL